MEKYLILSFTIALLSLNNIFSTQQLQFNSNQKAKVNFTPKTKAESKDKSNQNNKVKESEKKEKEKPNSNVYVKSLEKHSCKVLWPPFGDSLPNEKETYKPDILLRALGIGLCNLYEKYDSAKIREKDKDNRAYKSHYN